MSISLRSISLLQAACQPVPNPRRRAQAIENKGDFLKSWLTGEFMPAETPP
jgi:hypothetical protein